MMSIRGPRIEPRGLRSGRRRSRVPIPGIIAAGLLALAATAQPAPGQDSQRAGHALPAVEIFDASTGERTHRLRKPLTARALLRVEEALSGAGYQPGRADGRRSESTGRALRRFQRDEGLDPCGCVDWATVRRLGLPTAVTQTLVSGDEREGGAGRGVEVVYPDAPSPRAGGGEDGRARRRPDPAADTIRRAERRRPVAGRPGRHRRTLGIPVLRPRRPAPSADAGGRGRRSGRRAFPDRRSSVTSVPALPLFPFVRPVIRP